MRWSWSCRLRPSLPGAGVYEHVAPQATETRPERLAHVRDAMARAGASHHFISTVDDIAWLFNLRGSDVLYNPVFLAHALIDASQATLYAADGKISPALRAVLATDGVRIESYDSAGPSLGALPAGASLLIDPRRVTLGLRQRVRDSGPEPIRVIEAINPSTLLKSRKNSTGCPRTAATMFFAMSPR